VEALRRTGAEVEHRDSEYPRLVHGSGLGVVGTSAEGWINESIRFCEQARPSPLT
jgi:hypothetical protein